MWSGALEFVFSRGPSLWGWGCLWARRLVPCSLAGCCLRNRACWALPVPAECETTTTETWWLTYNIGEFRLNLHHPCIPWLLRAKAGVGRIPRFPMGPDQALERSVGRLWPAKMWRQWHGCPRRPRWAGDQPGTLRPHQTVTQDISGCVEWKPEPIKSKDIPAPSLILSPFADLPSHFKWTWGEGTLSSC